jgi:hypothetical protein
MPSFMKIRPMGAELFHTERVGGRTDMRSLKAAFRNFCEKRPKILAHEVLSKLITLLNVTVGSGGKILCGWVKVPCAPRPELNRLYIPHVT